MNSTEAIISKLKNDIENNQLKLPTQPEIAVRIREIEEDPDISAEKVAGIITLDPGLSARLIKIANSPLMRGKVHVDSLQNAINRLGLQFVCNTVIGLAMEQIFQATHEAVDKWMYDVWKESTEVAAYAYVLAKHYAKLPPDVASLAGLMHRIGILPILTYAQDNDELLDDAELLAKLIMENHFEIGKSILKSWEFPEEIINIVNVFDPNNQAAGPQTTAEFSDIIGVAVDMFNKKHALPKEIEKSEIYYNHLGISPDFRFEDDEKIEADLEEALALFQKH